MVPIDVGLSASTSSGAQSGQTGDFNVTGGGGGGLLSSLFPKLSSDKAWIVWIVVAGVAIFAIRYFKK